MAMMLALTAFAQKDVTKFLGIPVDGTKAQMIAKLKAKGFTTSTKPYKKGALTGTFNGRKVDLYVVTNNNKVYRIMVADQNEVDEPEIITRFNILCDQFKKNPKYMSFGEDYTIPENEDISYEMLVKNKQYDAIFYQKPNIDSIAMQQAILNTREKLLKKYTEDQLKNPTEEIKKQVETAGLEYVMELYSKKPVWIRIAKSELSFEKYYILMYYDNEYNKANGEDL